MTCLMRSAVAVAVFSLVACNIPDQEDSVDAGGVDAQPLDGIDVAQVEAIVEQGFKAPDRHSLTVFFKNDTTTPHFVEWARSYDGIDMGTEVTSVLLPTGWEARWHRELSEPEPVRTNDLVPFARAAANVGLGDAFARGEIEARLLYRPKFGVLAGANDGKLVVESYRLVVELKDPDFRIYVDAYTGDLVERVSQYTTVDEYDRAIGVPTMRYGQVTINATRYPTRYKVINGHEIPIVWSAPYYKDLTRASLLNLLDSTILDGQGYSASDGSPHTYDTVITTADYKNDVVYGLQETWDFYLERFGRRGIRNLQPSATSLANDAVARIEFDGCKTGGTNACMKSATGELTIATVSPMDYVKFTAIDVIAHEWTHAMYAERAGEDMDLYWGEEGGLMDATSDIFGELAEAYVQKKRGLPGMLDANVNPALNGWNMGGFRKMCTPGLDGGRDVWDPSINLVREDPHYAAGPINRVHCVLSRGLLDYTGNAAEPGLESQLVRKGFPGLTSIVVGNLWYSALAYLRALPRPRTFSDAREAMIFATSIYFGANSEQYKAVEDAYAVIAVGPRADRTPPQIRLINSLEGSPLGDPFPDPSKVALLVPGEQLKIDATDENGVASVRFSQPFNLGTCGPKEYTDSSAPWEFTVPNWPGGCDIFVTATDTRKNAATETITLIVDSLPPNVALQEITPCNSPPCSNYKTTRVYRVTASDPGGLKNIMLTIDGKPAGGITGNWPPLATVTQDFTVDYAVLKTTPLDPISEVHTVVATATDNSDNQNSTTKTYNLDLTSPAITSGPSIVESNSNDGHALIDFCASDASGIYGVALWVDGLVANPSIDAAPPNGSTSGCWTLRQKNLNVGTHQFFIKVTDRWGNERNVARDATIIGLDPKIYQYDLSVVQANPAYATLSFISSAQRGTKEIKITYFQGNTCSGTSYLHDDYFPASSSGSSLTYNTSIHGLTPGMTYNVLATVTGNNGKVVTRCSGSFTIPTSPPPPSDVVYDEGEANNSWLYANNVTSNYNVIRGTQPAGAIAEDDYFKVYIPNGKRLCVAAARTNNSTCPGVITVGPEGFWSGSPPSLPWIASMALKSSRSSVGPSDYVCSDSTLYLTYAMVQRHVYNMPAGSPYSYCPDQLAYDILIKFE